VLASCTPGVVDGGEGALNRKAPGIINIRVS